MIRSWIRRRLLALADAIAADEARIAERERLALYADERAGIFKRIAVQGGNRNIGAELAGAMRVQLEVFAQDIRSGLHDGGGGA